MAKRTTFLAKKLTDSNEGLWPLTAAISVGVCPIPVNLSEAAWTGGISSRRFSACSSAFSLLSQVL